MLIEASRSALLVIDVQERLLPSMANPDGVIRGCRLLLEAARHLSVPTVVSEQYPKGHGPTVPSLEALIPDGAITAKVHFSCLGDASLRKRISDLGRDQIIIGGIEAHVCVLQTALGLKQQGFVPFVVEDAVSSRTGDSRVCALARLRSNKVETVTAEMVLFEWLGRAGTDTFRELSRLIR